MLEGQTPELVVSGTPYYIGMRVKIEYYYFWWFKYLGWVSTVEGNIALYSTYYNWIGRRSHYYIHTENRSFYRIKCKNIVRMWHYLKIDTDLGI